jgi:spore germination cell wall hydrolase CwlJ-like protein
VDDPVATKRPVEAEPPLARWAWALWLAIFIGLPMIVAGVSKPVLRKAASPLFQWTRVAQPPRSASPPKVEAVAVLDITPETARQINAAVPFSTEPNPAAKPFHFVGDGVARERAADCLAAAQYYEAGDSGPDQRAVAQVVLNRLRHPAFPKTVCGVVFQGSERPTGCQFTFTCDGALTRVPSPAAWDRARMLALKMLDGAVDDRVGYATHYHTDWVVPYWSGTLNKITALGPHLFFRWKGWWGTPPAFRGKEDGAEPAVTKLAFLSPVHRTGFAGVSAAGIAPPDFSDLSRPAMAISRDRIGDRFGPGRLAAINSAGDAFAMLLDRNADPASFDKLARQLCAGRTKCRVLGWTKANAVPSAFPIDDETLAVMSYAYIRVTDAKLERSLYNCSEFPGQPKERCMRDRTPTPVAPPAIEATAPPRTGTETIRLPSS